MYRDLPPTWRRLNKTVAALAWIMVAGIAVGSTLFPPTTVTDFQPLPVTISWSVLSGVGSGLALLGVFRGSNGRECLGAVIAGAGVTAYALTVWLLIVFQDQATRTTQAFALSALVLFILCRAVTAATQAYRIRRAYENPPEV